MASPNLEAQREPIQCAADTHGNSRSPPALLLLGLVVQAGSHLALPVARVVIWPWTLLGLGPVVVGITAMVAGDARFKRAETPVSGQSPPTSLVTDGIFRWSRNPMYGGMLLLASGVALLLGSVTPWIVPPILARVLVVRFIRPEEALLRASFGEEYEDYAARASRWISIPGSRFPAGAGGRHEGGCDATGRSAGAGRSAGGKGLWLLLAWWALFSVCLLYGSFALFMGFQEGLSWLDLAEPEKARGAPVVFAVHALAGGIALLSGPLQLNPWLRARAPGIHRRVGYAYLLAVWIAGPAAVWSALSFEVVWASRILFWASAVLWLGSTGVAFVRVRRGDVMGHQDWMVRSFALSLFFVTFSLWVPLLALTGLPEEIGYSLGVFLSWALNLSVAEAWIRNRRTKVLASSEGASG